MTIKSVEELFRKRHAELKDQPEFLEEMRGESQTN